MQEGTELLPLAVGAGATPVQQDVQLSREKQKGPAPPPPWGTMLRGTHPCRDDRRWSQGGAELSLLLVHLIAERPKMRAHFPGLLHEPVTQPPLVNLLAKALLELPLKASKNSPPNPV